MANRLKGKVVAITGASSGIGRATAVAFARHGADLVLTARRQTALHAVAELCIEAGGRALIVPADVGDPARMEHVANRAVEAFGRLDLWVNNAGVMALGRLEDTPAEVFERVIRTDLLGTVNGTRAALPHFLEQGFGTVVNVASLAARVGHRYATAYAAAKFGVRGFSDSLRQELTGEPDIHVCTVLPASIDTPLWQHAANYTGRAVRPLRPLYPPEAVADAVLRLAEHPKREVLVGGVGRLAAMHQALLPGMTERTTARVIERSLFRDEPAPDTAGAVLHPMPGPNGVRGGRAGRGAPPVPDAVGRDRAFSWTNLALFLLPIGVMSRLPLRSAT